MVPPSVCWKFSYRTPRTDFKGFYVDDQGAVTGSWRFHPVEEGAADKLQPYSFHVSVDGQISDRSVVQWKNCLLLQNGCSQQANTFGLRYFNYT